MTLTERLAVAALTRGARLLGRAAYWAGRASGAREQVRDALECALLPRTLPWYPWGSALRLAWQALRGRDVRPFLRIRNLSRSVVREVSRHHEERLREHFARVRGERN